MRLLTLFAASAASLLLANAGLTTGAVAAPQADASPAANDDGPAVEPQALQALGRMSAYLRTLASFQIDAQTTTEQVMDDGQKLQFAGSVTYQVRRPDGFVVTTSDDRRVRQLFYDGKSLTLFSPRMGFYARMDAPGTIAETIAQARDKYDIDFPMTDLFRWGTAEDRRDDLTGGFYVGYAKIDGIDTDHFAFTEGDVDWQIWIQQGPKALPIKVVITTQDDDAKPEFSAVLHWTLNPVFKANTFAFNPPPSAHAITVAAASPQN